MTNNTKIEIFCGTGGVGKTTLAAARASFWGHQQQRVLLITIDPSLRLKQLFGLATTDRGAPRQVQIAPNAAITVQLMCPAATWDKILQQTDLNRHQLQHNYILNILARPDAGLLEILAMVEIKMHRDSQLWDVIVVDTPPGKGLLDFLDASNKISKFFHQTFIDFFHLLHKKKHQKITRFATNIINMGMEKLLEYLGKVTGDHFITNLLEAIYLVYNKKEIFLSTLDFQQHLKNSPATQWYLVTAADQQKLEELNTLEQKLLPQLQQRPTLLINKCNRPALLRWEVDPDGPLEKLKQSLLRQEQNLKRQLQAKGSYAIIEFTHCSRPDLHFQLGQLTKEWQQSV